MGNIEISLHFFYFNSDLLHVAFLSDYKRDLHYLINNVIFNY